MSIECAPNTQYTILNTKSFFIKKTRRHSYDNRFIRYRRIFRKHASRSSYGSPSNRYGSHKHGAAAYLRAVFYCGLILIFPVVIRGYRPRAYVNSLTHDRVAQIRMVLYLGAASDRSPYEFDEVPDLPAVAGADGSDQTWRT